MESLAVVESEIPTNRCPGFTDRTVGAQVGLLVLDRAPKVLDHDIVAPRAPAIHTDGDLIALQHAGEGLAGELTALIGIEDLRLAIARLIPMSAVDHPLCGSPIGRLI